LTFSIFCFGGMHGQLSPRSKFFLQESFLGKLGLLHT
jgi:hypothetical protein